MRQTTMAKPNEVVRQWYIVDGTGLTLGRLASEVATVLRGKHLPTYTPNVDTGDFVIIINADKIVVTSDNPASEDPQTIIDAVAAGVAAAQGSTAVFCAATTRTTGS